MRTEMTVALAIVFLLAGCGSGDSARTEPATEETTTAVIKSAPAAAAGPTGTATISGIVRYEGDVPAMKTIRMDADPGCAKKHAAPVKSEVLVLGEGNTLGNVFIRVAGGLPDGSYPPPGDAVVIDQVGCRYRPRVLGVMAGQPLQILNSDGLLHNIHALPEVNKTFNTAMPASRTEATVTFDQPEGMFKIKCDVHPWMGAWISVMPHPFFDVTAGDGRFSLENLPAGSYEIEAWHEKLGARTLTAEVADGQSVELEFIVKK